MEVTIKWSITDFNIFMIGVAVVLVTIIVIILMLLSQIKSFHNN